MITGEEIRRKRKEMGLTQKELAKKIGISFQTINGYENGKKIPSTKYQILDKALNQINVFDTDYSDDKGSIYKNTNGNTFKENSDGSYTITVPLVPFEAYASYVETLESEVARVEEWEDVAFNVDKIGKGNYLSFRSKGDSMNGGLLNDTPTNSLMLGRELGKHLWLDGFHKTDYGFVIVSKYSIMHKDITDLNKESGEITCHSRNPSPEHRDFPLNLNDVYQIFKVIKRTF
ncbi:helix-turn-helix transcriptional regulator [Tenacibaculum maritimum]|nr:helix-turn-helix transcriptional regulator [Tenacibaculum maritimum]MDB0600282.1 helix-turn-helix transcriptional regulator [Tenacibaculum maritimum]MDB0602122.1 helix-turn-helix transcriptional regulator [Tenacibaculum maritimum]MDB0610792.1 helix-turn-helix transcriptional regulator [Tenacibaculum maritimum]